MTMKQALITGGARGIGFGIAEAMLAAGYAVTLTGLTDEEVAAVPAHENLKAVRLDVTSDAEVAACIAPLSRLDALVNCAGIILRDGKEFTIKVSSRCWTSISPAPCACAWVRGPCWKNRAA